MPRSPHSLWFDLPNNIWWILDSTVDETANIIYCCVSFRCCFVSKEARRSVRGQLVLVVRCVENFYSRVRQKILRKPQKIGTFGSGVIRKESLSDFS
jgi:hypothetical protein